MSRPANANANARKLEFGEPEFRIVRRIGKGVAGNVNQAVNKLRPGQVVALKTFRIVRDKNDATSTDRGVEVSILRELYAYSVLKSGPGIMCTDRVIVECPLKAHEHGSIKITQPAAAMGDLQNYLANTLYPQVTKGQYHTEGDIKTLKQQLRSVALHVARGVEYMHSKNFVHLDLKPQNVLVLTPAQAVVSDFGLARVILPPSTYHIDEAEDYFTAYFRPPECFMEHRYSFKSDVFALGIVLFQVLFALDQTIAQRYRKVMECTGGEMSMSVWINKLCGVPIHNLEACSEFVRRSVDHLDAQSRTDARTLGIHEISRSGKCVFDTRTEEGRRAQDAFIRTRLMAMVPNMMNSPKTNVLLSDTAYVNEVIELLVPMLRYEDAYRPTAKEVCDSSFFNNVTAPTPITTPGSAMTALPVARTFQELFASQDGEITSTMRAKLVDWMLQVCTTKTVEVRTVGSSMIPTSTFPFTLFCASVELLDRVTTHMPRIGLGHYQLVGVMCITMCNRLFGEPLGDAFDIPFITDLCYNSFTKDQAYSAEMRILEVLGGRLFSEASPWWLRTVWSEDEARVALFNVYLLHTSSSSVVPSVPSQSVAATSLKNVFPRTDVPWWTQLGIVLSADGVVSTTLYKQVVKLL